MTAGMVQMDEDNYGKQIWTIARTGRPYVTRRRIGEPLPPRKFGMAAAQHRFSARTLRAGHFHVSRRGSNVKAPKHRPLLWPRWSQRERSDRSTNSWSPASRGEPRTDGRPRIDFGATYTHGSLKRNIHAVAIFVSKTRYSWAAPGDVNAFFGLMLDNIANLLLLVGLMSGIYGFPAKFALRYMVPGTALGVLVGDLLYFVHGRASCSTTGPPRT